MEITLSEFELERYTHRRMRELRGEVPEHRDVDPFVERYTARRIREICLERELAQRKIDLDNVALGGYTVVTMEAYRPDER